MRGKAVTASLASQHCTSLRVLPLIANCTDSSQLSRNVRSIIASGHKCFSVSPPWALQLPGHILSVTTVSTSQLHSIQRYGLISCQAPRTVFSPCYSGRWEEREVWSPKEFHLSVVLLRNVGSQLVNEHSWS